MEIKQVRVSIFVKKIIRLLSNNNKIENMSHFCCLSNKEDGKNVDTIYMFSSDELSNYRFDWDSR